MSDIIAFIGVGNMGNPMATNLHKAGYKIKVLNRFGNLFDLDNGILSKTFASYNQEGLIISDNQTRTYDKLSFKNKVKKRKQSWGK